ncbi:MAG: winged helix-turn-helix transcriptional regulator [Mycobacteriales bacterium]
MGYFAADCPARLVTELLADKWAVPVLHALGDRPCRPGDLRKRIGGVSAKVLTQTLRRLERHGMVSRTVYPVVPRHVDYALTALGRSLLEPIGALTRWAAEHGHEVLSALDEDPWDSTAPERLDGVPAR